MKVKKHTSFVVRIRSVVSQGMNLAHRVHTPKKGKGSYNRKNRQNGLDS